MKHVATSATVTSEISAKFHALLGSEEPLTLQKLEPFFRHLVITVCCQRDPKLQQTISVDNRVMAGKLFQYGCTHLKILNDRQASDMADDLITNHIPYYSYVYQLFTYILRLEKYTCGGYLRMMMPLLASMDTKWYPLHPYRSNMLVDVIQSFQICTEKHTCKSIMCYDPLDLLAKLKRIIHGTVGDQRYQGDAYLGYTLDSLRYVAIAYLGTYALRVIQDPIVQEQARLMLTRLVTLHQTVINTHIIKHTNQGG